MHAIREAYRTRTTTPLLSTVTQQIRIFYAELQRTKALDQRWRQGTDLLVVRTLGNDSANKEHDTFGPHYSDLDDENDTRPYDAAE